MKRPFSRQKLSNSRSSKVFIRRRAMIMVGFAIVGAAVLYVAQAAQTSLINPKAFLHINWLYPATDTGYTSTQFTVTPLADGAPDGYYYASQFGYKKSTDGGYIGLQNLAASPQGKIAIFSIWNAVGAEGDGYVGDFSGEGSGKTVRISYQWKLNTDYRLRVQKLSTESTGTWWGATVAEMSGDTVVGQSSIGKIKVQNERGNLNEQVTSFHERFSGDVLNCGQLYRSAVRFSKPSANYDAGSVQPWANKDVEPISRANQQSPVCAGNHYQQNSVPFTVQSSIGTKVPSGVLVGYAANCSSNYCWLAKEFQGTTTGSVLQGAWNADLDKDKILFVDVVKGGVQEDRYYCFNGSGSGTIKAWVNEGGQVNKEYAHFEQKDYTKNGSLGGCLFVPGRVTGVRTFHVQVIKGSGPVKISTIKAVKAPGINPAP